MPKTALDFKVFKLKYYTKKKASMRWDSSECYKSQGHYLSKNLGFFKKKGKTKEKKNWGQQPQVFHLYSLGTAVVIKTWEEGMPLLTQKQGGCPYMHFTSSRDSQMHPRGLTSKPCALGKTGYYSIWLQIFLTPVCFVLLLSKWSLSALRNIHSASSAWLRLRLSTHSPNL